MPWLHGDNMLELGSIMNHQGINCGVAECCAQSVYQEVLESSPPALMIADG